MSGTVCILDDDEAVRDSMRALLESYGLDVRAFGSCRDLLEADTESCDCYILDFHLPEMTGLDVLETLRERGVAAPATIISALSVRANPERLARAGVGTVMAKPVSEDDLMGWIKGVLEGISGTP